MGIRSSVRATTSDGESWDGGGKRTHRPWATLLQLPLVMEISDMLHHDASSFDERPSCRATRHAKLCLHGALVRGAVCRQAEPACCDLSVIRRHQSESSGVDVPSQPASQPAQWPIPFVFSSPSSGRKGWTCCGGEEQEPWSRRAACTGSLLVMSSQSEPKNVLFWNGDPSSLRPWPYLTATSPQNPPFPQRICTHIASLSMQQGSIVAARAFF